jgi:hypothetical protein
MCTQVSIGNGNHHSKKSAKFSFSSERSPHHSQHSKKKEHDLTFIWMCTMSAPKWKKLQNIYFVRCPFGQWCWSLLHLLIPSGDPFDVLVSLCDELHVPFFMGIIIIMTLSIWMASNDLIFEGQLTYTPSGGLVNEVV